MSHIGEGVVGKGWDPRGGGTGGRGGGGSCEGTDLRSIQIAYL